MFLHKTPTVVKWLYPRLTWAQPTEEKVIHLTFDDGPIPDLTDFVLETLKQYHAQATFFCVGDNLRKYITIAKRAIDEGHTLANHTFNHINGWNTSINDYVDNVWQCEQQLRALGQHSNTLRPPYGRIKRNQIKALEKDYKIVMWDVLSGDFSTRIKPGTCLKQTIRATRKGSIVLFHDNLKAEMNLQYTLPRYLDHYSAQGYQFAAL